MQSYEEMVMDELMDAPGTPSELAMVLDTAPRKIKKTLDRLQEQGLVYRVGNRDMFQSSPMYAMTRTKKTTQ